MTQEEADGYLMRGVESLCQQSLSIQAELDANPPPSPQKRADLNRKLAGLWEQAREMLTAHLGEEAADLLMLLSELHAYIRLKTNPSPPARPG